MDSLTFGQLLDIIARAHSVIVESDGADEHAELTGELEAVSTLIRDEIGASHMGTGADVVLIERGDTGETVKATVLREVLFFFEGSGNETAAEELRDQYSTLLGDDDADEDDGERLECGGCGESYNATESDANDPDTYCSEQCEKDDTDDGEDGGCPFDDPDCTSRADECHDACERKPAVPDGKGGVL